MLRIKMLRINFVTKPLRKNKLGNGKRRPYWFSLILLHLAHRADLSLSFVSLMTKTKKNGNYPFVNRLNRLNGLAHL
jgi:hypothetical protein